MTVVNNASVIFKDKNGNVGKVKAPSANDITKISTAISDVAQVVNPTTHLPINATTSSVGVVQLADSAAIAAGTAGRIVDAAQLKDAIEHVTPAGNLMTTDTAQTVTAVKTFSSLPESSVAPTTDNQLVNKKYVDDHATPLPSNLVTTDGAQTISAVKTFTALPQSSVAPGVSSDLVNKAYVDGQVDVDSTYTEPSVSKGILSPATNRLTPPSTAQELAIPQSRFLGETVISNVPAVDAAVHLKDGALLDGAGSYAEFVEHIADIYTAGTSPDSFCTEAQWQTSNTNYGFCNKFVYDSVANTVRLPKVNSEHGALIKSYSSGTEWYRIYQDGFCEQGIRGNAGGSIPLLIPYIDTNYTALASKGLDDNTGVATNVNINSNSNVQVSFGYNGYVPRPYFLVCFGYTDITDLQVSPIYEYIVVATVAKTAIQVDIDQIATDLNGKADTDLSNVPSSKGILVESYVNGASWYRKYSDGFCEQGGVTSIPNSATPTNFSLLVNYINTDYSVIVTSNPTSVFNNNTFDPQVITKTVSYFSVAANVGNSNKLNWRACGYIS